MRLAAVDIGSNTVHVLVADVVRNKLEDVAHYVEMPELGARVARTGSIGTKSRIAIRALRSVIARARKHGFDRLRKAALRELAHAPDGDVERLVATGGTASNLPFVLSRRSPPSVLTTADLLACERRLDVRRAAEVARQFGLPPN